MNIARISLHEARQMLNRIESVKAFMPEREALIMALEWFIGMHVSTSLGLEDWLKEQEGRPE